MYSDMREDLSVSDEFLDMNNQIHTPTLQRSQPPRPKKPLPFYEKKKASSALLECVVEQCFVDFKPIQSAGRNQFGPSPRIRKPYLLKCLCQISGFHGSNEYLHSRHCIQKSNRQHNVNGINNQISSLDYEGMPYFRKRSASRMMNLAPAPRANVQNAQAEESEDEDDAVDEIGAKIRVWNLNNRMDVH